MFYELVEKSRAVFWVTVFTKVIIISIKRKVTRFRIIIIKIVVVVAVVEIIGFIPTIAGFEFIFLAQV
jgi:hypothetical protein